MRLITTSLAAEDGNPYQTPFETRGVYRPVQVALTAAATVKIQGRAAPDLPWVDLVEITASGAEAVFAMREVRASVTGNTGDVEVEYDG